MIPLPLYLYEIAVAMLGEPLARHLYHPVYQSWWRPVARPLSLTKNGNRSTESV